MEEVHFKYVNHCHNQIEKILDAAENLFIEKGVKATSISDIANESRMMRSTLYKYFKNKDEILWALQYRKMQHIGNRITDKQKETHLSTYQKFELFLQILYDGFLDCPKDYLFLDLFNKIYQKETTSPENSVYSRTFKDGDFGSRDSMLFLTENFHDGSVKENLVPEETAVSIIYAALGILSKFGNNIFWLPKKYGIETSQLIQTCFKILLDGIRND